MSHALITGGTGQVGHFIAARFLVKGWQITNLSRRPALDISHIPYALGDRPKLPAADLLIHCAFDHLPGRYRGGEGDDPDGFRNRNLDGSITLFEAAKATGIPRVIFLSSRAVYGGYPPGTTLPDGLPPKPDTLYGDIKWQAEQALNALSSPEFSSASIRATGIYGRAPDGHENKWTETFVEFCSGQTPEPRVATELHVDDLADAVWRLRKGPTGAFNASDLMLDRHDLLQLIAKWTNCTTALPKRADANQVSAMTCERLTALGWKPGGRDKLEDCVPGMLITGYP